jgi:histidinol-phosphate aminotransferase
MACGATVSKVTFADDWTFPIAALGRAMQRDTRILIFASPSNPAGPAITESAFRALIDVTPKDTLIAFDEAYIEYVEASARFDALAILADCRQPWIVLRTCSKAYGLAGIRVGYGIASDAGLIDALMKTRNPFGVNALAVAAAQEALRDDAHLAKVVDHATAERARVAKELSAMGHACAPSQTNFIFFDTGTDASGFAENLRKKGILLKAWQEEPFCNWARVTMGTTAENDAFLAAVAALAPEN